MAEDRLVVDAGLIADGNVIVTVTVLDGYEILKPDAFAEAVVDVLNNDPRVSTVTTAILFSESQTNVLPT